MHLKSTAPIVKTAPQKEIEMIGARYDNDLPRILRPWFSFRVFFKWKKSLADTVESRHKNRNDTIHMYGFENSCTYRQCVNGHVDHILLDKLRGFNKCRYLVEVEYRDKFVLAQIYTRSVTPDGKFDVLVRQYNQKGEILTTGKDLKGKEDLIPTLIHPDNNRLLYFIVNTKGFIELAETPVPTTQEFHELVTESLNK